MADALNPEQPKASRPLLAFTALTILACAVLVCCLDRPLALLLHRYAAGAVPFFAMGTAAIDTAYDAAMCNFWHLPVLWWALVLGYVAGRWLLRQRRATVLLVALLTHLSSEVSANVLKVLAHRERPAFIAGHDLGGSFHSAGPHWDSFPSSHTAIYWSLFWPLAVAFPRWRLPLLVVPVFIALGRLVLSAHYLSDVWAATWLAVAWAALWRWVLSRVDKKAA